MARSKYIYVVDVEHTRHVVAAFTVKHECQKFLASNNPSYYRVSRFRDGAIGLHDFVTRFSGEEFVKSDRPIPKI